MRSSMDGKYLEQSRNEMAEAVEQSVVAEADDHALRSLAALTEAFAELEVRVTNLETGPRAGGSVVASETIALYTPAA